MGTEAHKNAVDPETMTNTEMHAHFTKLVVDRAQDVDTRLEEATEKIVGIEATLTKQLGDILARLPPVAAAAPAPPPPPAANVANAANTVGRARRVPLQPGQHSAAAPGATATAVNGAAAAGPYDYAGNGEWEEGLGDNGEVVQQPGRPRAYHRDARQPHQPVRDDDHVA